MLVLGFALADATLVIVNDAFLIAGPESSIGDRGSYGRVCLISGVSTPAASKRRSRVAQMTTREITLRNREFADSGIYENDIAPISGASIRQRCGASAVAIHMMVMMLVSVRLTGHIVSLHFGRHRSTGAEQKYERQFHRRINSRSITPGTTPLPRVLITIPRSVILISFACFLLGF